MKRGVDFEFREENTKKLKLQNNDDVWEDDFEVEEIDKCLKLATQQIYTQNLENQNLTISSYDQFKPNQNIYTSTQNVWKPSTSTQNHNETVDFMQKIKKLEIDNRKITESFQTKEGEIVILRSKLKQAEQTIDVERRQKIEALQEAELKWNHTLVELKKTVNSYKCQLHLKNLETLNLKEKISEVKKVYNSNVPNEEFNFTQIERIKEKLSTTQSKLTSKICKFVQTENNNRNFYLSEIYYPLCSSFPPSLFENWENNSTMLISKSTPPVLHNIFTNKQSGNVINLKCKRLSKGNELRLNDVFPEVHFLIQCTEKELHSSQAVSSIFKILLLARKMLLNLLETLQFELVTSCNDNEATNNTKLLPTNIQYDNDCILDKKAWHDNEAGIEIRRCLGVAAVLILHCDPAHRYYAGQLGADELKKIVSIDSNNYYEESDLDFLQILVKVTKDLEKVKRIYQFSGCLSAILKLLSNLIVKEKQPSTECYNIIRQIFNNIIVLRPSKPVFKYVAEFLRNISRHSKFVKQLCRKHKKPVAVLRDIKEDVCILHLLATEMQLYELHTIAIASCMFDFLESWVLCNGNQQQERCKCVTELYKAGIKLLYNSLQEYSKNSSNLDDSSRNIYHKVFRSAVLFFHNLTTRNPDLGARCLRLYSQCHVSLQHINQIKSRLDFRTIHEIAFDALLSQKDNVIESELKLKDSSENVDLFLNRILSTLE